MKIRLHTYDLESKIKGIDNWNIPEKEKVFVKEFMKELALGRVNKTQLSINTACTYQNMLRVSLEFFNKMSEKLILEDIRTYSESLTRDTIKKNVQGHGTKSINPFKESVKLRIKYTLLIYLKWRLKEKSSQFIETLKIKPRIKKNSVEFLSEQEVLKLLGGCKSNEERFLIAVLFDSGARAEEFYNIRREDIELPESTTGFVRLNLKTEYSKTEGRTIPLCWYKTYEIVRDFVKQRISEGCENNEPLIKIKYRTAREWIHKLGYKILNKNVYFHLMRHSSATYYADKLNRQQLCIRYGWKFSSTMPDTYISRTGLNTKEVEDKFENLERVKIQEENNKLKSEFALFKSQMEEEIKKLQKTLIKEMMSEKEIVVNKKYSPEQKEEMKKLVNQILEK